MPRILRHSDLLGKLRSSKRWRKNSDLYEDVTRALSDVINMMYHPVTQDSVQRMDQLERNLRVKAKLYLDSRKNPKTSEGKARYEAIQSIMELKGMGDELRDPKKVKEFGQHGRIIANIIQDDRVPQEIDISLKDTKEVGAGASKRIRFEHKGKIGFFSPELAITRETGTFKAGYDSLTFEDKTLLKNPKLKGTKEYMEGGGVIEDKTDTELMRNLGISDLSDFTEEEIGATLKLYKGICKAGTLKETSEAAGIKQGEEISKRNIATSRMANMMGLGSKVAQTDPMTVRYDGKSISGSFMAAAVGYDSRSYDGLKFMTEHKIDFTSGSLQRDINRMQVFDMLCGQIDRHGGNFLYQIKPTPNERGEHVVTGIQGIDNDMAFGEKNLDSGIGQMPSINQLTLIDEESLHSLREMTDDKIKYTLGGMLNDDEIKAVSVRRDQILQKVQNGQVRVVRADEWGPATLDASKQTPYYQEVERELGNSKPAFEKKYAEICDEYTEKKTRMEAYNRKHPEKMQVIPEKPEGYDKYMLQKMQKDYVKRMEEYELAVKLARKNNHEHLPEMPAGYAKFVEDRAAKQMKDQPVEIIPDKPVQRKEVSVSELEGKPVQQTTKVIKPSSSTEKKPQSEL